MSRPEPHPPGSSWLLFVAVVAVGLNLRGPIVAVSPVLDRIQGELGISETAAGLLTTLPVLCFAAVSPLVGVLARRIGTNPTVAVSLLALAAALAVRPWSGFGLLVAGTVLMGAAIAVGNVLLPVVARRDFGEAREPKQKHSGEAREPKQNNSAARAGPVMSAVTTSLLVSATIPAFLTVPLASVVGWRAALGVWALLATVALAIWYLATGRHTGDEPADPLAPPVASAWRVGAAWQLGVFFGLQSLLFYGTTAWLPTMLQADGGLDATAAGAALSAFQLLGIAGALAVPVLIRGQRLRYAVAATLAVLWLAFFAGLLLAPAGWPAWCVLGGIAQGGGIAMALSLIAMRSSGGDAARTVSTVVQTIGYCLGAAGPVLLGGISAATAGWTVPFVALIAVAVGWGILGVRSAAPRAIR